MFLFTILVILAISSVSSERREVASSAQIKFAESQNYDGTGPGAESPDRVHKTFVNLDDALISYADDPDTKLPETERFKAFLKLGRPVNIDYSFRTTLKPVVAHRVKFTQGFNLPAPKEYRETFLHDSSPRHALDLRGLKHIHVQADKLTFADKEPFKMEKIRYLKESPVNIAHFARYNDAIESKLYDGHLYNKKPEYTFSYGVHDQETGDSKAAKETLKDGVVQGYYTVMDPDGKQRTVHYTADDHSGFKAVVQRTNTNKQ